MNTTNYGAGNSEGPSPAGVGRLFLLGSIVMLGACYGPALFSLIVAERQRPPVVFYSATDGEFLFMRQGAEDTVRTNQAGEILDRAEFERRLPLMHAPQLIKDGTMPEVIAGWKWDPVEARRARMNLRLRSWQTDSPAVALYPLFDGESGRVRLEVPADFIRLRNTVEVVLPKGNRIDSAATTALRQLFEKAEFDFPVRLVGGNPTTLKPYDEGYFLLDQSGALFHLQRRSGTVHLERVAMDSFPGGEKAFLGMHPVFLLVQEHENRLIRLLVVGRGGEIFALTNPQSTWRRLLLESYDPSIMDLGIRADALHILANATGAEIVEASVFRNDFFRENQYRETLPGWDETLEGKITRTLFPFTWQLESVHSGFLGFYASLGNATAFGISGLLAVGWLVLRIRGRLAGPETALECLFIFLGGVLGMLAVALVSAQPAVSPARHKYLV